MKKSIKYVIYALIILMVAYFVFKFVSAPKYPDIYTPKDILGNKTGKVVIVEFSDLQCPACARAHPVLKQIYREHINDISIEFYHYPLPIHEFGALAAEGTECANDQGKFWDFVEMAYANQKDLSKKSLKRIAEQIELNSTLFNSCLDSGAKRSIVNADTREGNLKNIKGTPTFYVNGRELGSWEYSNFKRTIENELRK
ncbi:MAG TPA: DsbA family protein [Candidatus Nanoarchaeia archaeon]|nr:DsbA family protein [Candidatus Nanoarchaeia archaeon]